MLPRVTIFGDNCLSSHEGIYSPFDDPILWVFHQAEQILSRLFWRESKALYQQVPLRAVTEPAGSDQVFGAIRSAEGSWHPVVNFF